MKTTGTIYDINSQRGMVAVLTETNGFSIFEMLWDDNFKKGDEVSWKGDNPLGDCKIKNHTEDEEAEVYFQNHGVTQSNLRRQLLYP